MNRRERAVVIFLVVTLVAGAGLAAYRRWDTKRRQARSPIVIENPVDTLVGAGTLVDLNTARQYELEALPGIGPVLAQRIIQFREQTGGFRRIDQLRQVSGIGPKRFAAIRGLVTVGQDSCARRQAGTGR